MKVEILEHMGSDLSIVNAARVSFQKESSWDTIEQEIVKDDGSVLKIPKEVLKGGDARLIAFLAKHKHIMPFAHPHISFRCEAPIAIVRQLYKHKVGFVESEVSRRYVDSTPEIYFPEKWRAKNPDKKQGSYEDVFVDKIEFSMMPSFDLGGRAYPTEYVEDIHIAYRLAVNNCVRTYEAMIKAGVCPEQARFVLPQGMYTTWVWTSSLLGYARMHGLRNKPDTQKETRFFAEEIGKKLQELFPISWLALTQV